MIILLIIISPKRKRKLLAILLNQIFYYYRFIIYSILLFFSLADIFHIQIDLPYFSFIFGNPENIELTFSIFIFFFAFGEIAAFLTLIATVILIIIVGMEIYPYYKLIMQRDSIVYSIFTLFGGLAQFTLYIIGFFMLLFWFIGIPLIEILLSGGGGNYNYESNDYQHPGYHYVEDYYRSDGTHVEGHWKTNPVEYKWNNISD